MLNRFRMNDSPLNTAIKNVVNQDGMTRAYEDRLTALIENSMRANIDDSDIESLLEIIEIVDSTDEN